MPPGATCLPQVVGPGLRQATLVVSATPDAAAWTGEIKVKGTATIDGRQVVREARPATITWPAPDNVPAVGRLDRSLVLAVREKPLFTLTANLDKVTATPGEKVTVPVKLIRHRPEAKAPVQLSVLNLPMPPNNPQPAPSVTLGPDAGQGNVVFDVRPDATPGTYTVIIRGQMQVSGVKDADGKPRPNYTAVLPSPPITLTVEPKKK